MSGIELWIELSPTQCIMCNRPFNEVERTLGCVFVLSSVENEIATPQYKGESVKMASVEHPKYTLEWIRAVIDK